MARALRAGDPKEAKPSKPKILVFGLAGVGKTWTALDFPSVYYIDAEGGANLPRYTDKLKRSGGVYLGPDAGANDFAVVTEEIITLATTKHPYRTLVIDSYSKLFGTAVAIEYERMEKAGRDMEKTFGAEKKPAIKWSRRWLHWFEKLDMNVLLICHQRDEYKDGKMTGTTFDGWDKLSYELHLALNVIKQGTSRRARVFKSRLGNFPDADVFDWTYEEFSRRHGREVMEAQAETVSLATAEQMEQYQALLKVVKIDAKVTEKWAEVDDVDLDAETVTKRIEWLAKQIPKTA